MRERRESRGGGFGDGMMGRDGYLARNGEIWSLRGVVVEGSIDWFSWP